MLPLLAFCLFVAGCQLSGAAANAEAASRIAAVKQRRQWNPFDLSHPYVKSKLSEGVQRPNILIVLVDDLGYGDTSLPPFDTPRKTAADWPCSTGGYVTPNLERMAANGLKLTNFHAAAPVCSPARGSLMTGTVTIALCSIILTLCLIKIYSGLHAWRLGALNAYELGRDLSQRNGFLAQVKTGIIN